MKHIRTLYALITASVITPLFAFAQFGPYQSGYQPANPQLFYGGGFGGGGGGGYGYQTRAAQFGNIESLIALAQTLLGYAQVIIFVIALFFFLFAAFKFVKGDVAGGGKTLGFAVIGVVIALLAFSIIPLLCFITQSGGGRACNL